MLVRQTLWNKWVLRGIEHNKGNNEKAGESLFCIFGHLDEYMSQRGTQADVYAAWHSRYLPFGLSDNND